MLKKEVESELIKTKIVLNYARQELKDKNKEIERLNNIITELEKWHKKEIEEWEESKNKSVNSIAIGEHIISLNKIKELKRDKLTIEPYTIEDNMKIGDTFIVGGEK